MKENTFVTIVGLSSPITAEGVSSWDSMFTGTVELEILENSFWAGEILGEIGRQSGFITETSSLSFITKPWY